MSTRVLVSVLILAIGATAGAAQQKDADHSLYKRLGGYDTIAAVVKEFDRRWVEDPLLHALDVGFSADSGKRQIQLLILYFCEQAGGPCTYLGRNMKTAHAGLTLTEAHWKAFMTILSASLDAVKVPAKEKAEALEIFARSKADIGIK